MEYDIGAEQSVSVAVTKAVSEFEDCSLNSLPPLYETVAPDCLDGLYSTQADGTCRNEGSISFVFSNSQVKVDNQEYILVQEV
jgi:Halobacterial output domain 1